MEQNGDKVFELRQKAGLTQGDLARLLGCDQTTISGIERGRNSPMIGRAIEVLRAMGATKVRISRSSLMRPILDLPIRLQWTKKERQNWLSSFEKILDDCIEVLD